LSALAETVELVKEFPVHRGFVRRAGWARAVDRVSLAVGRGEGLALVGESGSGKTTLGRCLIRLLEPTAGTVRFDGIDLSGLGRRELRRLRRRFQMVFQDPYGSLDPRLTAGESAARPLAVHTALGPGERRAAVADLFALVGLAPALAGRYPHELSGGQRQRVGIARALATRPDLVVADEPVSALDVSVRAQILNLLSDLRARLGLALLFISHDLAAVEHLADRVAVLYLGRLVEVAPADALFAAPQHPYTVSLLSAVPVAAPAGLAGRQPGGGGRRIVLRGEPPDPARRPAGCPFAPRCPVAEARCSQEEPPLAAVGGGVGGSGAGPAHLTACFFPGVLPPPAAGVR
jgi:oligopeptide/dipeptide ABC transporter ATP-binding protein